MPKQLIVLGMHRSYTTLMATWLHKNGIPMFDSTRSSPHYFEDPDFFALHEEFLASQGMNWMNAHAPFSDPTGVYRERSLALWNARNSVQEIWGWKDPRTCILFDFLWAPFAQNAKFIVVYRDPAEVLESLLNRKIRKRSRYKAVPDSIYGWYLKRHRRQYDNAHLVAWNYYHRSLLHTLEKKHPEDYLVLDIHAFIENEEHIRKTLMERWGFPVNAFPLQEILTPLREPGASLAGLNSAVVADTKELFTKITALRSYPEK